MPEPFTVGQATRQGTTPPGTSALTASEIDETCFKKGNRPTSASALKVESSAVSSQTIDDADDATDPIGNVSRKSVEREIYDFEEMKSLRQCKASVPAKIVKLKLLFVKVKGLKLEHGFVSRCPSSWTYRAWLEGILEDADTVVLRASSVQGLPPDDGKVRSLCKIHFLHLALPEIIPPCSRSVADCSVADCDGIHLIRCDHFNKLESECINSSAKRIIRKNLSPISGLPSSPSAATPDEAMSMVWRDVIESASPAMKKSLMGIQLDGNFPRKSDLVHQVFDALEDPLQAIVFTSFQREGAFSGGGGRTLKDRAGNAYIVDPHEVLVRVEDSAIKLSPGDRSMPDTLLSVIHFHLDFITERLDLDVSNTHNVCQAIFAMIEFRKKLAHSMLQTPDMVQEFPKYVEEFRNNATVCMEFFSSDVFWRSEEEVQRYKKGCENAETQLDALADPSVRSGALLTLQEVERVLVDTFSVGASHFLFPNRKECDAKLKKYRQDRNRNHSKPKKGEKPKKGDLGQPDADVLCKQLKEPDSPLEKYTPAIDDIMNKRYELCHGMRSGAQSKTPRRISYTRHLQRDLHIVVGLMSKNAIEPTTKADLDVCQKILEKLGDTLLVLVAQNSGCT